MAAQAGGGGGDPTLQNSFIWRNDANQNVGMLFEGGNVYFLYWNQSGRPNVWSGREQIGTWSGNTITATYPEDPDTTFTVSGNKLYEYSLPSLFKI